MPGRRLMPIVLSVFSLASSLFAQDASTAAPLSLGPTPEQPFSGDSTSAPDAPPPVAPVTNAAAPSVTAEVPKAEPATPEESIALPKPPSPTPAEEATFSKSLNTETPTPFYRQWLNNLFDLLEPGTPYSRDKLTFVLGTSVGYDNNVLYSATDHVSSATYGVNGSADYHFGTRRLKIDAKLAAGINYYENRPGGSNDNNYSLVLEVDYQLKPRLGFSLNTTTAYLSQPAPQFVGNAFLFTGSYFYTDTTFGLVYQYRPRIGITASYEVNEYKYDDAVINAGSGFFQQTFSLGTNYLYSPRTSFVLQYRYNPVYYNTPGSGSVGNLLLVGINQSLTERLSYSLTGGAEYRQLESSSPGESSSYLGPFVEGTLSYVVSPTSNLSTTFRYGTEPSGGTGVRTTFRAALGGMHKFGDSLTLNANVGIERDDYSEPAGTPDVTQNIYTASISLQYNLTMATAIVLADNYTYFNGYVADSAYTRNFISLGLQVTF